MCVSTVTGRLTFVTNILSTSECASAESFSASPRLRRGRDVPSFQDHCGKGSTKIAGSIVAELTLLKRRLARANPVVCIEIAMILVVFSFDDRLPYKLVSGHL